MQLTHGDISNDQAIANRLEIELALGTTRIAVLPQGDFRVDRPPEITSGCRLVGAGRENTILRCAFVGEGVDLVPPVLSPNQWRQFKMNAGLEMRYVVDGAPVRPMRRSQYGKTDVKPIVPVENVRVENLTFEYGIGLYLCAGFDFYRVRAGAVDSDFCTNLRFTECELGMLSFRETEDSVFNGLRMKGGICLRGCTDLWFDELRLVGDAIAEASCLGCRIRNFRVDGKIEGPWEKFP